MEVKERPAVRTQLSVDYPRQHERIAWPQYTMRFSAPDDARSMEVSIDGGDWRSCRKSVGHWWFDWFGYGEGEHEVVARIRTDDGRIVSSEPHSFGVRQNPWNNA